MKLKLLIKLLFFSNRPKLNNALLQKDVKFFEILELIISLRLHPTAVVLVLNISELKFELKLEIFILQTQIQTYQII